MRSSDKESHNFVPWVDLTFSKVEAFGKIEVLVAMCNFKIACELLLY